MKYSVKKAVEVLSNTPNVLATMLRGVSDEWSLSNYGEDTWSAFDIVGHLIHGERADWIPRMRIILEHGESRPFDPFDRYAQVKENKGKTIANLLAEFARLRAENIETLLAMKLTDEQLDKRGTHPALGQVMLRELLSAWVVHDLNHVAQIAKAMAFQYENQVGPWQAYLSILRPPNPL
jgi:uncharacterized damage-inducible protein DinB